MFKKIVILSMISTLFVLASEDFEISDKDVEVVEVEKKQDKKPEKIELTIEEDMNNIQKPKNKETFDEEVVIEEAENSELGETVDISSGEEEVIDDNTVPNTEPSFVPKKYTNVKYSKKYSWFSLIKDKRALFDLIFASINPRNSMDNIKDNISNPKYIVLNALYYDLIKHDPSIAENFYLIMYKNYNKPQHFTFRWSNLMLVDYLLRTGRPKPARKLIKPMDCVIYSKVRYKCYYYDGVLNYLLNGNPKNESLLKAKKHVEKAKLIYEKGKKRTKLKKKAW